MKTTTSRQVLDLARARRLARTGDARRIRQGAGLSLADVAGVVGVDVSTLSRWETGDRRPMGRPAVAYARLLEKLSEANGAH
jgi:DNA-binding transcriptional regulator YiaG